MKIEILCTGDEILSGKTVNTNYSYIARKLVDHGFSVSWGTVVGDDRESLVTAFTQAGERIDAVIVNGGLGPTVDDLSQEVAASAAGVPLTLNEAWLERMRVWYESRGRVMPENNRKQAMLPEGAEFIDNPVGTACGFAIDIRGARFFFTPGVPREMRRMIDQEILPRLQEIRGWQQLTTVKRFHSFGIGESNADQILNGIEQMTADGSIKLGFQSHYPQLETKLTVQGKSEQDINQTLAPVASELRDRLGHFVMAEDDETVEGRIIDAIAESGSSLAVVEMFTAGGIVSRLQREPRNDDNHFVRRGIVSMDLTTIAQSVGLSGAALSGLSRQQAAAELVKALRLSSDATHGLVVLTDLNQDHQMSGFGADFSLAIYDGDRLECRSGRLPGGRDWIVLGATELGLDCLRRYLYGAPVDQRIDFEQH